MSKNTVYIIGAGASYEIGLPVGNALKTEIASLLKMNLDHSRLSGDEQIYTFLRRQFQNNGFDEYIAACRHISKSMPLAISIDNFIDCERANPAIAFCGKLGILKSILQAEKRSSIYVNKERSYATTIRFDQLENTWYLPFFRTITENCSADDLKERFNKITLVIFNYDRCIEHFLLHALIAYYSLDEKSAVRLIEEITIIHPYGTIGELKWQAKQASTYIDFGGDIESYHFVPCTNNLKTFTESPNADSMQLLRPNMLKAQRLVFLGFAFHRPNMSILSNSEYTQHQNDTEVEIYATAFDASKSDREIIKSSLRHLYKGPVSINIEHMTCAQIFKDYSRSLGYW